MQIELSTTDEGLLGKKEVWVRVLSNTVVDWPEVKRNLTAEQVAELGYMPTAPVAFWPDQRDPEEKAASGFLYEDYFIFEAGR